MPYLPSVERGGQDTTPVVKMCFQRLTSSVVSHSCSSSIIKHLTLKAYDSASLQTSESSVYSLDSSQDHTAPSHLNLASHWDTGSVLSGGRGWTSRRRPEKNSWCLSTRCYLTWINNIRCLGVRDKLEFVKCFINWSEQGLSSSSSSENKTQTFVPKDRCKNRWWTL